MTPAAPRSGRLGVVRRASDSALAVTGALLVAVVVITWPLAAGLTRDVPADFGDPLFVMWAIARASAHWTDLLKGDLTAVSRFWDARIFHPEPLTGAYSEHFAAHALLTLPAWWLTHNPILSYNLLFLGSSVLCGLGMYLLVRDVTGHGPSAVVAGLCFACAPYRVSVASHLQVESAQWMPLALFALRRFIVTGRQAALAGAVAAIWLQNLSCGYYMLFFAPLAGVWSACWLTAERRWSDIRRVGSLVAAGVATLLLTLPFALPYLAVQRRFGGTGRSADEAALYSADVGAWLTASPWLTLWGWARAFPRLEGELFLGVGMPVLAAIGLMAAVRRDGTRTHRAAAMFAVATVIFAVWMALGPRPTAWGRPLPVPSLFAVAYDHVPGFNATRVPARFQMIVLLAGSMLAGLGAWALRRRPALVAALAVLAVLDGAAVPFPVNIFWAPTVEARPPPDRVSYIDPPRVYTYLQTLSAVEVVVHFPLGAAEHDIRYMFHSPTVRAAMVNGYSGNLPPDWLERLASLSWPLRDMARAWAYLRELDVTHAVVHADVWRDDTGWRLGEALEARGARPVFRDRADVVYQLPAR